MAGRWQGRDPSGTPVSHTFTAPSVSSRERLRERFKNADRILAEWFDDYMKDIPKFEAMLKDYEDNDYDPE